MKYLTVRFNKNNTNSISRYNLRKSLIRIGELDPLQVGRFSLGRKIKQLNNNMNNNAYINRGILNVRKFINTNLGKSGKFTNRMIKNMMLNLPKNNYKFKPNSEEKIKICQNMFLRIAKAVFKLLCMCDISYAQGLFDCTKSDTAITIYTYEKGDCIKIAVPMQAYMVIASSPESKVCKTILGELGNVEYSE